MYEIFMHVKLYAEIECELDVNGCMIELGFQGKS